MDQVNVREFRGRMSFYLQHLPLQLTVKGIVIAEVRQAAGMCTQEEDCVHTEAAGVHKEGVHNKEEKVAKLRALIKPIEEKGQGQPQASERRKYVEYNEERGEDVIIEGTFEEMRQKYGKVKGAAIWKQAKPIQ